MTTILKRNRIKPSIQMENDTGDAIKEGETRVSSPDPLQTTLNLVNEMTDNKHKFIENNKKIERSLTKKINELETKIESYQKKINLYRQSIKKYKKLINENYDQVDNSQFCTIL